MMKIAIALALGACIGAACRYFDVPVPAPPKLVGALLVLAITLGYIGTDMLLRSNPDASPAASMTETPANTDARP